MRQAFVVDDEAGLDALEADLHPTVFAEVERQLISYALKRCEGNRVQAARLLGISRSMLRDRMKRYDPMSEEDS